MASNSFGKQFRITTWGESHGKGIGVVIDGCPAGLELSEEDIQKELNRRAPGTSPHTSPRKESDRAEIWSGVFEGRTTGAPISIVIANHDADPSKYEPIKDFLRPGHANYTYLEKYGIFDYRGGGRASGRETACRVAAGAIAKKWLKRGGVHMVAYLQQLGSVEAHHQEGSIQSLRVSVDNNPIFCPDLEASERMIKHLQQAQADGDSLGGIVQVAVEGIPAGLGDPVYEKLEAMLASAMMSIPASKGFEIGSGFDSVAMRGSEHNDLFVQKEGKVTCLTNHSGGVLGGISTGMPIVAKVAFKPTSGIKKAQETVNIQGQRASFQLPEGSRHDPCLAIRAVPVVEAMAALVLVDAFLLNRLYSL